MTFVDSGAWFAKFVQDDPDQIHRAWILFQGRHRSGWSFTDCTSKIVIDDLEIGTALAMDDHFRAFGNVVVLP